VGLVSYIVVGAVIGLIATVLSRRSRNLLLYIILGIVGALVGGAIGRLAGFKGVVRSFNLDSFVIALICAVVLLLVVGLLRARMAR
jgi:uncharacterized membrane protein YeaQ/YmgE (transglycosylase-associated protein family)